MTPEELRKRTKTFAVEVVGFCRRLPRTDETRVASWQLLRAGTAVGANYRAVCRCRSDKDFISKLGIVIEETDEVAFWLELLADAGIGERSRYEESPSRGRRTHSDLRKLARNGTAQSKSEASRPNDQIAQRAVRKSLIKNH